MNRLCAVLLVVLTFTAFLVLAIQPAKASGDLWVKLAPMPVSSSTFEATALNGKIYAVSAIFTCVYDPSTNTWASKTPLPNPPNPWGTYAIAACEGKVYAFGGYTPIWFGKISTLMYDPSTDKWTSKTPMPTPRFSLQANAVGDRIYLISGWLNNTNPPTKGLINIISNVTEAYKPLSDSWTELAPIPIPVMNYVSAVIGDKIYIIGGETPSSEANVTQIYDTTTNTWSFGKPLPASVSPNNIEDMAAAATKGTFAPARIYVMGGDERAGNTVNKVFNLTEIYNPTEDSWTTGASMPTSRANPAMAVVNDTVYVLGGTDFSPLPQNAMVTSTFATNEEYFPLGYQGTIVTNPPTPIPTATPTTRPSPNWVKLTAAPSHVDSTSSSTNVIIAVVIASIIAAAALTIALVVKTRRRRTEP